MESGEQRQVRRPMTNRRDGPNSPAVHFLLSTFSQSNQGTALKFGGMAEEAENGRRNSDNGSRHL